jgi:hypothetical protein
MKLAWKLEQKTDEQVHGKQHDLVQIGTRIWNILLAKNPYPDHRCRHPHLDQNHLHLANQSLLFHTVVIFIFREIHNFRGLKSSVGLQNFCSRTF